MTTSCHNVNGWMHLAQLFGPRKEKAGIVNRKGRNGLCRWEIMLLPLFAGFCKYFPWWHLLGVWIVFDLWWHLLPALAYHPVFNVLKAVSSISSVTVVTVSLVVL